MNYRRIIGVALVVVAVVALARVTLAALHRNVESAVSAPAAPAPAATVEPTPTPSESTPAPQPKPSPSKTPSIPTASELAVRFVAAWLNTSGGKQAWLGRLRPLVNGEFYDGLALTDVANVPHGGVRPGSKVLQQDSANALVYVPVSGDAGAQAVTMTLQDGRWVAVSIDRAT